MDNFEGIGIKKLRFWFPLWIRPLGKWFPVEDASVCCCKRTHTSNAYSSCLAREDFAP